MCMYIYDDIFPQNYASQGKTDHWSTPSNHWVKEHWMDTTYYCTLNKNISLTKVTYFQRYTAVHQFCTKSGTNVPQDSSAVSTIMFTENEQVLFSDIMHVPYSVRCQLVQTPGTRVCMHCRTMIPYTLVPYV
jgi:hypothetical protein